jgi:Transposase DDE domain
MAGCRFEFPDLKISQTMQNEPITTLRDVFIYAIIDDFLKSNTTNHQKHVSATGVAVKLTDSEILFIYITACLDFGGNMANAMRSHYRNNAIRSMIDKSGFNRRLHGLIPQIWGIFMLLAYLAKESNEEYSIDSFPISVCKNIRINRSRIVKGAEYRGYNASKREYFYGFKVHAIVAKDGRIIEFDFSPGKYFDTVAFKLLPFDLPEFSKVFADKAYNDYKEEDNLLENGQISLETIRKSNSKKKDNTYVSNYLKQCCRKHIEPEFSAIGTLLPKSIHAVTETGFLLKLMGFLIAHNFNFYF